MKRRAETKGNADRQSTHRTQSRVSVSQALERIRQAIAVVTRGRSRMRESCTYGLCGGPPAMEVPTATGGRSSRCSAERLHGRSRRLLNTQADCRPSASWAALQQRLRANARQRLSNVCASWAGSKAVPSRSSIDGLKGAASDWPRSRPSSSASRSMSSLRRAPRRRSRQSRRLRSSRQSSRSQEILSVPA